METKWVTVRDAVELVKLSKASIYRVLNDPRCRVRTITGPDKVMRVHAGDLLKAAGERLPGRPRGTASINGRKTTKEQP